MLIFGVTMSLMLIDKTYIFENVEEVSFKFLLCLVWEFFKLLNQSILKIIHHKLNFLQVLQ